MLRARGSALERDVAYGAVRLLLERPLAALTAADRAEVMGEAAALARPALAVAGAEERAPPDRAFAVLHGLFWCVANLADRGPLLLALDDAHWFDAASLRFVHYLARRVADVPVAMMVATRDAEHGAEAALAQQLTLEPAAEVLRPAPLTADGVAAVVAQRMASTVAPEFGAACHTAVGGNAFLLTELVGTLVADRIEPTAQSAAHIRDVRPPALSRAILLRVSRMPAGAAALAAAVAVIGDGASLAEAAMLAGQDEPTAVAAFDHLAAAEILAPALPTAFVHPIVREVVYDDLGPAQRAQWHARAARLIFDTGGSLERAASHLLSTTPTARPETVTVLRRAARGALDRGASDRARSSCDRAAASRDRPGPALPSAGTGLARGRGAAGGRRRRASPRVLRGRLGIGSRTQLRDALGESAGSADLPSPEALR